MDTNTHPEEPESAVEEISDSMIGQYLSLLPDRKSTRLNSSH